MSNLVIRAAQIEDAATILKFIIELASYEKAAHEVTTNIAAIERSLFSPEATAYALLCEVDGQAIGFAVYFFNYSTWLGKNGLYLEDLYIAPEHRGSGAGKAILKYLAKLAVANNCGRVEWAVLNWNQPAIDFYQAIGAKPQDEWTTYRLTGEALSKFAAD
ncbi:GNAT family N-acetyltransferase [Shewanella sp. C32]|uniref:GNAT family N-acetyltransferase n=1 Tax=Shewanella electrica TaxID=515560 RepID=A0ABT2FL47_9GAMM|nr:GNAT family N-acetyltransferase [Shewanella electrica]MCH1924837.1 GNAT family N-acetyltransferase [Shewanella electrica]MCS4556716.1 GNAT family N-acetyltransferase [Shewanella electrica]